jgi:hypothetical protein
MFVVIAGSVVGVLDTRIGGNGDGYGCRNSGGNRGNRDGGRDVGESGGGNGSGNSGVSDLGKGSEGLASGDGLGGCDGRYGSLGDYERTSDLLMSDLLMSDLLMSGMLLSGILMSGVGSDLILKLRRGKGVEIVLVTVFLLRAVRGLLLVRRLMVLGLGRVVLGCRVVFRYLYSSHCLVLWYRPVFAELPVFRYCYPPVLRYSHSPVGWLLVLCLLVLRYWCISRYCPQSPTMTCSCLVVLFRVSSRSVILW